MLKPEFSSVSVGLLRPNPWNTNRVAADNEAKIRASIERNGLFKPIVVRQVKDVAGYEIIGGEHRWEQAKELGMTEVPICNLGFISEKQAKEIGVIDNARYGADDTLSFAELLKELGDADELQEFLPYGETDLNAIFSASDIALDSLEIDESFEREAEAAEEEGPVTRPAKTHAVMRFKLSLGDAERVTALISRTQKEQGLTTADDLTNAGDALVHLLQSLLPKPVHLADEDEIDAALQEIAS
ncbi:ParB/RepB/Spo0J family partition protein [Ancylobacter rudongensis]|uniref:ParB/RepB/Spo0J family partition protein n=1 Tax=Ancylobacter rudongensis TaxID=177413 RepID=A0A1G4UPW5_9HYPH|nr:ParB/RepB/Spo0J family partition protein [Ancylobacter rudongensis]SCW95584.1 ParB/RepB/Spo0J family partition protein [Ancylobacter rudongensis]